MSAFDWVTALLPTFLKVVEALASGSEEDERAAMIDLQERISRQKALKKFGPRVPE